METTTDSGKSHKSSSQSLLHQSHQDTWRSYATMCRLCLQKDGFMLGIFNNIHGKEKSISKKITDCTALEIHQGDGLPNVICHRCLYKIEFCIEFRQLCFLSDATLRQFENAAKQSQEIKSHSLVQFYEQLATGKDENVVMVVDPTVMDYESDYESENEKASDTEVNELDGKNVFMCKFCDHAFTDMGECNEHETTAHNAEQPYKCFGCSMTFADRLLYSAHMKSVHKNDKPYNCPQCERTFARRSDLRKHTIVHTGVKPYTCSVCLKSFSRNTNLSKHMRIHSGSKPFVCLKCPRTFTSRGDLNRHALIHTGQKPFRCNYCHLSFGRKDKLLRHEKRHWPQENSKDKSHELQMMREHLDLDLVGQYNYNNSTTNDKNQQQQQNDKQENMIITLDPFNHDVRDEPSVVQRTIENEEQKGHDDDFPSVPEHIKDEFTTVHDPLLFPQAIDQQQHITGENIEEDIKSEPDNLLVEQLYKCPDCPKTFTTSDNLKYHSAKHTGLRPFTCTFCTKTFLRKRELDRHIMTHTGVKPFKCTKCLKSFGRKDKLVRHMRIHERRDTTMGRKFFINPDRIRKPLFLQKQQQQQQQEQQQPE